MNTYAMILYWQNKYLVMENEVRKAQKGITRLKKREKYLLACNESNTKFLTDRLNDIQIRHDENIEKIEKYYETNKL